MMIDLWWPFLILLLAAAVAVGYGRIRPSAFSITWLSCLLALGPLAALGFTLYGLGLVAEGTAVTWQIDWLPSRGLSLGFYFDSLSGLFAFLITGIGTLVIFYTGSYFKGDASAWRFRAYLLLFMIAVLGLVMAGDVITLFIFWEATSVLSYLLVAYKDEAARQGAFRALFITAGGGVFLLLGLLLVSQVSGGSDWTTILAGGVALRTSPLYVLMLVLVAGGIDHETGTRDLRRLFGVGGVRVYSAAGRLYTAAGDREGGGIRRGAGAKCSRDQSWGWLGRRDSANFAVVGYRAGDIPRAGFGRLSGGAAI